MKACLLFSDILGNCEVFWSQLPSDIEFFYIHLVSTTYGDAVSGSRRSYLRMVLIMMVRVIFRESRKFKFKAEIAYSLSSLLFLLLLSKEFQGSEPSAPFMPM